MFTERSWLEVLCRRIVSYAEGWSVSSKPSTGLPTLVGCSWLLTQYVHYTRTWTAHGVTLRSLKGLDRLTCGMFLMQRSRFVGFLGRVMGRSRGLHLQGTPQHRKTRTDIRFERHSNHDVLVSAQRNRWCNLNCLALYFEASWFECRRCYRPPWLRLPWVYSVFTGKFRNSVVKVTRGFFQTLVYTSHGHVPISITNCCWFCPHSFHVFNHNP